MTRATHPSTNTATPNAEVPDVGEPTCDELDVRIFANATDGGSEGTPVVKWVGRLRHLTEAKLSAWGLGSLADDARLLVSELVTNALQYGQHGEIGFRLLITLQGLLIAVDDGSHHRPQLTVADADSESGRGLFLVASIADEWGVSPDGTTTWCTLTLGGAGR
ncbi:ATP-binding protein [Actinacidiphila sp. DG2A-62]|uniref:ATP-binding protein n=1 Tax=Actinacidiphila sp. DG2A-62 TaxID=3108821 RepID=UPI002DBE3BC8|nr:ATP-binding protein [Actinacidiphila sp. DG2A-62]MEC3993648.1 ATP-binding protein [Actinacidiphila sp. DG2A-62]